MNRRSFLKKAIAGVTVAAVAGTVGLSGVIVTKAPAAPVVVDAVIGSYADYCSFSAMSIAAAVDKCVAESAKELSYRAGCTVQYLYNS